jgi:glyoxylase-like metal-dependent hydrolase (beta-lactamase superfamily II)
MNNVAYYHFTIGKFKATIIGDGQAQFPPHPLYAPNASKTQVEDALSNHFLPTDFYTLQCNVMLLERDKEKILIDTGAGTSLGPQLGKLYHNLSAIHVKPEEITSILITHCHLDHISGLISENGAPNFPNALIFLAEKEWNFWKEDFIDLSPMLLEDAFKQNFINAAHRNLRPLRDKIQTFKFGQEVVSGVYAIDAVGHTPGHTAFLIQSDNVSFLNVGDVFHHPAFDLEHPEWATAFDQDPKQAYKTRIKMLDQAATDKVMLTSYHVPFPAVGHVRKKGNHYEWEGIMWKF